MPKSITTAFETELAKETTTFCTMFRVQRTDGVVFTATDHDADIVWSGETYAASSGYSTSDIETGSDLNTDNLDIQGFLVSPSITETDLKAGLWDYAAYRIFRINYKDLTMGSMSERSGHLGEVRLQRDQFVAELRGKMDAYRITLGRMEGPACNATLGDARCKVRVNPPVWQHNTAYTVANATHDGAAGSIVSPTTPNGFIFSCGTAGTSGATEPAWTLIVDGVTTDGTAVWQTRRALTSPGTLTGVNPDNITLYDTSRTEAGPTGGIAITGVSNANPCVVTLASAPTPALAEGQVVSISGIVGPSLLNVVAVVHSPSGTTFQLDVDTTDTATYPPYVSGGTVTPLGGDSGFYDFGLITMTSGLNNGLSREIKSYVPGQITLYLPFPYQETIGDTYSIRAGCDKSMTTCRDRFFNLNNFRGFPYLPGIDKITQVGRHNS